ncbi:hypothetical protein PFLuk1_02068 [Pseudomonas fluorescens]|nr:hypothetical protein PFLuk1_03726 [Pseudomonas fluorescens]KWV72918.1 hypothetical protein PFLuk1_02068 [Pseudomonas fluorescens]
MKCQILIIVRSVPFNLEVSSTGASPIPSMVGIGKVVRLSSSRSRIGEGVSRPLRMRKYCTLIRWPNGAILAPTTSGGTVKSTVLRVLPSWVSQWLPMSGMPVQHARIRSVGSICAKVTRMVAPAVTASGANWSGALDASRTSGQGRSPNALPTVTSSISERRVRPPFAGIIE